MSRRPAPQRPSTADRRPLLVRALISLAVLVAATAAVITSSPTLGLDLRGGTQVVLETQDGPNVEANAENTDRALEVLRKRVDALGVAEPTLARSGERRIIVELPGLTEPQEAVEIIGRTAQLTFHPVTGVGAPPAAGEDAEEDPEAARELSDESGQSLSLGDAALTGEGVRGADAGYDLQNAGGWFVTVDFAGPGRAAWEQMTGEAACAPAGDPSRRVAIVLDDEVISSPQVNESVPCGVGITGGSTQITGGFSADEARDLAVLIEGGALPLPVEVIEQRTVGPTLGAAAIDASVKAVLIGLVLTAVFIIYVYRLMGLLAVVALSCYAMIAYAALLGLGATITLPGLAGFVLAVGMAVDANVLVYERAREEVVEQGKGLRVATTTGFQKALSAIVDSNVTTLLAAGLLFFLASGPVRGFGVTLTVGVLVSMFSALVITRVLAEYAASRPWLVKRPNLSGINEAGKVRLWLNRRDPQLYRKHRPWLAVGLALVVVSGGGLVARDLDLGVEFTGGRSIQYETTTQVDPEVAREAVSDAGFPRAVVQSSGDQGISVRTGPIDDNEAAAVRAAVDEVAGGTEVISDELIGPTLGDELRRNALIALGVALAAQLAYLAFRFRWTYGAGAVAALATNVTVVVGTFAWLGKPIDGVFLAALLTVIGYSVNDSVVVFDRIRERWAESKGQGSYAKLASTAVTQTLPRTVNTGISTIFVLVALLLLGGDSLSDFALALIIGIAVGTASTIAIAVPLTVELHRRWPPPPPAPPKPKQRNEGVRSSSGAVV